LCRSARARAGVDPGGFRHRPAGPVRPLTRRFGSVIPTTRSIIAGINGDLPGGRVASCNKPSTPSAITPRLPAPDRRLAFAGLPLDRHRADPIGAQQHNLSAPHVFLWAVARSDHGLKPFPIARTEAGPRCLFSSSQTRISSSPPKSSVSAYPLGMPAADYRLSETSACHRRG
jgi:hypothetical protein